MSPYSVLVVVSDGALVRALRERLDPEFEVQEIADGELASTCAADESPDLVVLGLGGYGAIDTIREFRTVSQASMLVLVDGAVDVVDAVDAGADDYLRLPCSPREIAAKVRSARRRRSWTSELEPTLRFGDLTIDRAAREVQIRGAAVVLPQREYDVLAFLASSPRRVFSRTELLHEVWRASTDWLGPATVTEHIRRLRMRLLAASGEDRWIRTVRGAGYRFDP